MKTLDELKSMSQTQLIAYAFYSQGIKQLLKNLRDKGEAEDKNFILIMQDEPVLVRGKPEVTIDVLFTLIEILCEEYKLNFVQVLTDIISKANKNDLS